MQVAETTQRLRVKSRWPGSNCMCRLTVNWDIYPAADSNGADQILIDPTEDKIACRPTDQEKDVP